MLGCARDPAGVGGGPGVGRAHQDLGDAWPRRLPPPSPGSFLPEPRPAPRSSPPPARWCCDRTDPGRGAGGGGGGVTGAQASASPPRARSSNCEAGGQRPLRAGGRAAGRRFPAPRREAERGPGSQDAGGEAAMPPGRALTRVPARRRPESGVGVCPFPLLPPPVGTAMALGVSPLESYSGTFLPVPSETE